MCRRIVLGGVLLVAYIFALRLTGTAQGAQGAPSRARDWAQDSAMKIGEPFSFASVGDVIITRPASQSTDAGLQSALKLLRDADASFGNFESLIRDERSFVGPLGGSMTGTKEVAAISRRWASPS